MTITKSHIELIVRDIEQNRPQFMRATDLIDAGLFQSRSDVSHAIKRGQAPPTIRLSSHKIVFPRATLCEWIREKAKTCFIDELVVR